MRSSPEQASGTEKGRVFDVRRFCVHDGGGIRTTVFLKGCPLNCAWCQNPEGISPEIKPLRFENRCVKCGACTGLDKDWPARIDACPTGALRFDGRRVSVDELMSEIMLDAPFFAHGGGVTLSGGDPLAQPEFSRAILARCREKGLNTAIETELYANWDACREVLRLCDTVYADLKLFASRSHYKYTGVENGLILENIGRLLAGDTRGAVIIRTPMIPNITASEENIAAIARFVSQIYPEVRYELLNYNPLAAAKYPLVGKEYCFKENPRKFTAGEMEAFADIARRNGAKNTTCV